jgi:carbamoyl-phosphate synthase large subunit
VGKRTDIHSILIIGAGPIIIGQACEFDYSGSQACKAMRDEGYRVILVNSNPATIMTDPGMADATYIEPITWETVAKIIEIEKPDALLPTMGGQTALNCALELSNKGILKKFGVELIGAKEKAIEKAEDRSKFRDAMQSIGLETAKSFIAHTLEEAESAQRKLGFPIVVRPSFTMGGSGGGIAFNEEEYREICRGGLEASPTSEILLEESLLGWKEFEMEVVRDRADNCIIICSIENLDPMGIHTGDSITVAPAQTLTDKEYQLMRNASVAILREIGVDTGGSNVQFAVDPESGRLVVIEMNPRVSRSSALASKATGFPIAKIAAKLAIGYTLDELRNEITDGTMPASFEPSIDYVVTKIPRFTFEKFPQAEDRLTTQMKSVGEVMAMGRSFQESFQKALRGLETGVSGLDSVVDLKTVSKEVISRELSIAGAERIWYLGDAFRLGFSLEEVFALTSIDPWFLSQIEEIIQLELSLKSRSLESVSVDELFALKRKGFSDARLANVLELRESEIFAYRKKLNVKPIYKRIDSCAAEFDASTPYMYSSYDEECEAEPSDLRKIIVLGGGPNRIGQGIEFDYCCVQAAIAVHDAGFESIMVNCNPETVSTDYDTSDRLYFEPVTLEDVLEIIELEKPYGVIVQYGGQTPLKLARALEENGVPIIGTSPDSIDLAEDRERFKEFLNDIGLKQPPNRIIKSTSEAKSMASEIGYPLVVRPSYVLGGRAMEVVYNEADLMTYMDAAVAVSNDSPILLDHFLDRAIEVDVDAVCDGKEVFIGGIMEHIEQAGVHSGDSACSLPPHTLSSAIQSELRDQVIKMALGLKVIGLMNVQFAIQDGMINPRASRTAPFVSKAIGMSIPYIGAKCMIGESLKQQGVTAIRVPSYYSVKEAVFPFIKFRGVDPVLGPEMKSTGEVMGIGASFGEAFGKAQVAANMALPLTGSVFVSVRDGHKEEICGVIRKLHTEGFLIYATVGTARYLQEAGIECIKVNKVTEGRPHIVDMIKDKKISLIINTSADKRSKAESGSIRAKALQHRVAYTTTVAGAAAAAIAMLDKSAVKVRCLQTLHEEFLI